MFKKSPLNLIIPQQKVYKQYLKKLYGREIMNEDKLILAMAEDKLTQCQENYMITNTGFLDMRQQTLCKKMLRSRSDVRGFFYGGYADSERRIGVFIPEYIHMETEEELHEYFLNNIEDNPLTLIRAEHSGYKELTHRDYLGSLIGMGIKREAIGDILVHQKGADILVLRTITEFLLVNYSKAGRTNLTLREEKIERIISPEVYSEERNVTVASLRLDNVVAAAFKLSRSAAVQAIKSGVVFLDGMQTEKPEKIVGQGDKIVLRGKGKTVLREIGGNTRKDRVYITIMIMK